MRPKSSEKKIPDHRWHIVPMGFILISIVLMLFVAYTAGPLLGHLETALYLAAGLSVAAILWFRSEMSEEASKLSAERQALEIEKNAHQEKVRDFETAKRRLESELDRRAKKLRNQECRFSERLTKYHEWMEFPLSPDDSEIPDEPVDTDEAGTLRQRDEEVLALIREKSEQIFNKIKNSDYLINGEFERDRLYADLLDLFESVARVYSPDSKQPILETSLEHLLRATNRIALQMLVLLEQLPFNFKDYNIRSAYDTVQKAVRTYDTYKSFLPYWDYLRPVYYLGRLAMGATPATLGAGWAISEIATRSVKKLSSHLVNQYALSLLHDLVFVVGSEAASIFGGDFRRREPNWIYGTELTDMICRFPASREMLKAALNEIGQIQLRSEYDRIFLYRCLTAQKSAEPERFETGDVLSDEERRMIVERLEKFCEKYIHGNAADIRRWKADVEKRMDLKLNLLPELLDERAAGDSAEHRMIALRSLAGFLFEYKKTAPEALPHLLGESEFLDGFDDGERGGFIDRLAADPSGAFEIPNLDPANPVVEKWLTEWMQLCVDIYPHDVPAEVLIGQITRFYRRKDEKSLNKRINRMYADHLAGRLAPESPERKLKPHLARHFLAMLAPGESPSLIYSQVRIPVEPDVEAIAEKDGRFRGKWWLMATDRVLKVIAITEESGGTTASEVWSAERLEFPEIRIQCVENRFSKDCRLIGGRWIDGLPATDDGPASISIAGRTMVRYETYFGPLLKLME